MSARRAASQHADSSAAAPRASRGRAGPRGAATPPGHSLLLDTHIWVWWLAGDTMPMSAALPARIERACNNGACYVSDISAWEVATKSARQVLSLTMDSASWLEEAASAPGLTTMAVSREILIASARLPIDTLPDLVDRILVATALRHGLTVVTADRALLTFQLSWPVFQVIDAQR